MNIHSLARTCPQSRALLVRRVEEEGRKVSEVARELGVSRRTVYKWLGRYREEGLGGLQDRSSRPHRSPRRTCSRRHAEVLALRRQRMTGPEIAHALAMPRSTVGRVLQRAGVGRIKQLDPPPPPQRYERERPGDLLHIDTKKLGRIVGGPGHRVHGDRRSRRRGVGWEYVHVAIDDHSRLAYVEVLESETGEACAGFLERALAWYRGHGVEVREVMTDNAFAYVNSRRFRGVMWTRRIRHIRTRPYTPRTNGKAERLIQTLLREWAYRWSYQNSAQRTQGLGPWLDHYNRRRPHGSLEGQPPISRIQAAA